MQSTWKKLIPFEFYVEIVENGSDPEVIEAYIGPMSLSRAEKTKSGASINLNNQLFCAYSTRGWR